MANEKCPMVNKLLCSFMSLWQRIVTEPGTIVTEPGTISFLLGALRHIAFTEVEWQAAADLDRSLRAGGKTPPLMGIFIAAVCLRHHFPLLTLDEHFRTIRGLTLA
jgi:predicted nucleic acid-binding protein